MKAAIDNLCAQLEQRFREKVGLCDICTDQIVMTVPNEDLIEVCTALRDEEAFAFEQLMDLCGVDFSTYGQADWKTDNATSTGFSRGVTSVSYQKPHSDQRFAVVYQLLSITHNQRLRLRSYVTGEPPMIASVTDIWASANWYEREAFDLFGILFDGHPDLRRILTDYGFSGHPFRKDFPLEGNVEVRYDESKGRVIYQPVTIENRVLVPRVIRDDHRYSGRANTDA